MIDIVVLLLILFFAFVGLRKGLWQYLSELLITAVSLVAAFYYYQKNPEVFKSILAFIWIYAGLSLLKWFMGKIRKKPVPAKPGIFSISRLAGGILGSIWGAFIVSIIILTFDLLPAEAVVGLNIKEKVQKSQACQIVRTLIPLKNIKILDNINCMSKVSLDEDAKRRLMEQPQFQQLLEHKTLKTVLEDEKLVKQLQNKNLPRLFSNPKIRNLLNDGEFVEKLMKVDFEKALEQ